ncbi:hypothetical protein FF36_05680 [Frankia torreyi]|uniref:Uncharacterized protein n=1 Tax=Frankia torreyi TaxID=1856 RepID=A0A0D8B9G0_9ACTN|nr:MULTISPECIES: hypothetical protein [Frankia]KJE20017.1 hypothetical protein FF36_05680 [Frankia torreyi]KQM02015.1 hypothetical protein FF86_10869 [Frankia sp. CpI1-P]
MPFTSGTTDPGREPVPLTVWTTHAQGDELFSEDVLGRVLDAYSRRGDLVLSTTSVPPVVGDRCITAGRRHRTVSTTTDTDILTGHRLGAAALIVDLHTSTASRTVRAAMYSRLAALLRPAGILLIGLPPSISDGGDPLTDTAAAACSAGLTYTQHLLAVRIPLPDGFLVPPADWDPADDPTLPTPLPPLRVHADIAVFTRPTVRSSR